MRSNPHQSVDDSAFALWEEVEYTERGRGGRMLALLLRCKTSDFTRSKNLAATVQAFECIPEADGFGQARGAKH